MLEIKYNGNQIDSSADIQDSVVVPPCYIGAGVKIKNTVVGPHVSLGENTTLLNCVIKNSIIQKNSHLHSIIADNSMVGSSVKLHGQAKDLSVGDFTNITE